MGIVHFDVDGHGDLGLKVAIGEEEAILLGWVMGKEPL